MIDENLLAKYKKKEETYTMAAIYAKYGEKFRIFPQYQLLGGTYRTDGFLSLIQETIPGMYIPEEDQKDCEIYPGGILLEIDDKDHASYDPEEDVNILLETQKDDLQTKLLKMTQHKTKYMNKYRTTKTELDTSRKTGEYLQQKLGMYQTKLAESHSVYKYKNKVSRYEKKIKEHQDTITTLEDESKKLKEKAKKYIKILQENTDLKKKFELLKKANKATPLVEKESNDEEEKKPKVVIPVKASVHTQKSLNIIKSVTELKDMCKTRGISGYSGKSKADLITFMLSHKKFV